MIARLQSLRETRILRPFGALLSAQLIGSGLGFVYWVLAARMLTTDVVGVSSAAITTQALVGSVAMLGLGTLMLGELKVAPSTEQRPMVVSALGTAASFGTVLATVVMLVTPFFSESLRLAFAQPVLAIAFVAGVAATAAGLVLDQAVLGLGRPHTQVWRNLIASGLRFPIAGVLIWYGQATASVVVFSWAASVCISLVAVWPMLRLPPGRLGGLRRYVARVRQHGREALSHHLLNLSLSAGPMLVPFVAALVLSPVSNGEFAVAWLLATFVFLPPYLLATALFAVSAKGTRADFRASAKHTLPAALALSGALCAATWVLSPFILGMFGQHYADNSKLTLDLLVVGGLWMVLKDHLVAYARVTDQLLRASTLCVGGVAIELVGAVLGGALGGQRGLALGWLLVLVIESIVGIVLAMRVLRAPRGSTSDPALDRSDRTGGAPTAVADPLPDHVSSKES